MDSSRPRYATHNVVEFEPANTGGSYLRRFPHSVRKALSHLGHMVSEEAAGVEIRFVTEAQSFRVSLGVEPTCLDPFEVNTLDVFIFKGDFFHSRRRLEAGKINHLVVADVGGAMHERIKAISPAVLRGRRFSPEVWRVFIGRFPATLVELSTYGYPCRAPLASEVPAKRWLAYGSSITNGSAASLHYLAYIYQAAHRLGVDVFNQGLSGSCRCEPEMADYLAARKDWDLVTLELGVNMRQGFTLEEFEQRASYLVNKVAGAHPDKPVAVISIYPNADMPPACRDSESQVARQQGAFNEALARIVKQIGNNVHLIDGSRVLREFTGLTMDFLHPGDYGHIEMGLHLAELLKPLFETGKSTREQDQQVSPMGA